MASIGDYAFDGCTGLTSITIPESVTSIGRFAFYNCTSLTSITIPEGVTSIGDEVFENCTGLTSVTIPESVTNIGDYAFRGCSGLTGIWVDANNPAYCNDDSGVLFNKNKTSLICCPAVFSGTYAVPESVTYIGWHAFDNCTGLTSVTIPEGVTRIEYDAFDGCTGLTSVTILNPDCSISSYSGSTLGSSGTTTIIGYKDSTAQTYAEKYGYTFKQYSDCANGIHAYEVMTTATCTEAGTETYTCGVCGDSYTMEVDAYGHSYSCTVDKRWIKTYTCSRCGDIYTEESAREIIPDTPQTAQITTAGAYVYYFYTPEYTESYTFSSSGSVDTYGYLYNADGSQITYNDDGDSGSNFSITYTLTAGTTYYFGARLYNSSKTGKFEVTLYANHNYAVSGQTAATCVQPGSITYTCSNCGATKTEAIAALGHIDENKDNNCDRCGEKLGDTPISATKEYKLATELKDGDEVVLYNPGNGKALAGEMSSYYVAGVDVTPADNKITGPDAKLVWKVKKNDDGSFTFTQDGGNILGTDSRENNGKTYNLYVSGEHKSTWTVEVANAETSANYIYSSAMTGSYGKIYVEWYAKNSAFSAYDTGVDRVTEKDFGFQFYVKSAEEPQPSKDITVCFTNDVHGAYELYPYAATAMKGADLIVDAGDNIQGSVATTLTNGQCMVDLMKTVGYDVAVPGNHEFDYGFARFLEIVNGDNTPYVSANLWDKTADKAVLDAYKIFTVGDKKVAVVGITTPETLVKSTPAFFQNEAGEYIYDFCNDTTGEKLYTVVQKAVDAAKAEGADYVIAVGHLGIDEQSEPWTSTSVIANTTGIDALIDGHSHSTFSNTAKNKDGKEIPVAQTGTQLKNVGKLTIAADGTITATVLPLYEVKTRVNETTGKEEKYNVYLYDTDPTVSAKVAEIKAEVEKVSNKVVARTEVDLTTLDPATGKRAVRNAETNLGDLCADAYRELLKTDVAFVNGGFVRATINKGDITYGQIIAVHPFGNTACKIEVTGEQLWTALEIGSAACPGESGGFLQVSGIEYTINTAIPTPARFNENKEFEKLEGEHRVTDVKVNGEPLDVNKTYTLGGHNYMLINGGDGYTVFKGSKILAQEVAIDNEVLIKYITGTLNGVVGADSIYANPTGAGRIKIVTPAHEHTYGDVKYTWTADGETFTCTAYKECTVSGCGDKLTATGTVTAKDDPAATCTAEGKRVFTATFTEDGFGTDTKTVDLPALGHVDEDKDNKCDRCGEKLGDTPTPSGDKYVAATELKEGDQVILVCDSKNVALCGTYNGFYNNGLEGAPVDGVIENPDSTIVWTVGKEGEFYTFSYDGKKIGMGTSYTSMTLGGVNYKWQVEAAATEGCFYVKNLDRDATKPYYMQWYETNKSWSGYHTLNETLMALRFYVKTA